VVVPVPLAAAAAGPAAAAAAADPAAASRTTAGWGLLRQLPIQSSQLKLIDTIFNRAHTKIAAAAAASYYVCVFDILWGGGRDDFVLKQAPGVLDCERE
jgi:hypothetical protein